MIITPRCTRNKRKLASLVTCASDNPGQKSLPGSPSDPQWNARPRDLSRSRKPSSIQRFTKHFLSAQWCSPEVSQCLWLDSPNPLEPWHQPRSRSRSPYNHSKSEAFSASLCLPNRHIRSRWRTLSGPSQVSNDLCRRRCRSNMSRAPCLRSPPPLCTLLLSRLVCRSSARQAVLWRCSMTTRLRRRGLLTCQSGSKQVLHHHLSRYLLVLRNPQRLHRRRSVGKLRPGIHMLAILLRRHSLRYHH